LSFQTQLTPVDWYKDAVYPLRPGPPQPLVGNSNFLDTDLSRAGDDQFNEVADHNAVTGNGRRFAHHQGKLGVPLADKIVRNFYAVALGQADGPAIVHEARFGWVGSGNIHRDGRNGLAE